MDNEMIQSHYDARDRFVYTLGEPDDDLLAPLINPSFIGGPRWPSMRQSWRRVRRNQNTIIISDGLSDPFDSEAEINVGFGVEVLVESPDPISEPIQSSWLFRLVYDLSQQAADSGAFRNLYDNYGLFSIELYLQDGFEPFVTHEGRVGVLLGLQPPGQELDWQLPAGLVRVVTARLLFPSELALIHSEKEAGRQKLQELFIANNTFHSSSLSRKPVL